GAVPRGRVHRRARARLRRRHRAHRHGDETRGGRRVGRAERRPGLTPGSGADARYGKERMEPYILGITGATGAVYAQRLLRHLKDLGAEVHVVLTEHGRQVVAYEGCRSILDEADKVYRNDDLFAPIASGSYRHKGMIIAPCSMATLG